METWALILIIWAADARLPPAMTVVPGFNSGADCDAVAAALPARLGKAVRPQHDVTAFCVRQAED